MGKYLQATCFLRSKYPKYIRSLYNFIEKLENVKGEKGGWKEKGERIRTCLKMSTNLNRYFSKNGTSMFSKYMKLLSIQEITRETQILSKISLQNYWDNYELKYRDDNDSKSSWECREMEMFIHCPSVKLHSHCRKQYECFSITLETEFS